MRVWSKTLAPASTLIVLQSIVLASIKLHLSRTVVRVMKRKNNYAVGWPPIKSVTQNSQTVLENHNNGSATPPRNELEIDVKKLVLSQQWSTQPTAAGNVAQVL